MGLSLFFFNDTATTEIYTLSLHDALPICWSLVCRLSGLRGFCFRMFTWPTGSRLKTLPARDRKSTRLNSNHGYISYAVFCLKKKNILSESTWLVLFCLYGAPIRMILLLPE